MIPTPGGATNGGATFRGSDNDNDILINQKTFMDVFDQPMIMSPFSRMSQTTNLRARTLFVSFHDT